MQTEHKMQWSQIITIAFSVLAGFWAINQSNQQLIFRFEERLREDQQQDRQRWSALFEKFHILDKDVEKFRVYIPNGPR